MLYVDYFTVKMAVWDTLANDVSPSQVMRALSELRSGALARWSECEPYSEESFAWNAVYVACGALADGINGATYVRQHETTKYAKRRAERVKEAKNLAHAVLSSKPEEEQVVTLARHTLTLCLTT